MYDLSKKIGLASLFFLLLSYYGVSQTYTWVTGDGGVYSEEVNDIAVDAAGNSYVVGYFDPTASFGATTLSSSDRSPFIAKYNSSGTLQWAVAPTCPAGTKYVTEATGVAISGSGASAKIYVTGVMEGGTYSFGAHTVTTSAGGFIDDGVFITQLDANGNFNWASSVNSGGAVAGAFNIEYHNIAADIDGNCYITGAFYNTISCGSTALTAVSSTDAFLTKLSPTGAFVWAVRDGGNAQDYPKAIAVSENNDHVYYTGYYYNNTSTFGSTSMGNATNSRFILVKYDSSGSFQWVRNATGTGINIGRGVDVGPDGSVYATGYFTNSATFSGNSISSSGGNDHFLVKYNSSGTVQWLNKMGSTNSEGQHIDVSASAPGNLIVAGYFSGTASFGATTVSSVSSTVDAYFASYENTGTLNWVITAGGDSIDEGNAIDIAPTYDAYIAGSFSKTSSFGALTASTNGKYDTYLAKISLNWLPINLLGFTAIPANNKVYLNWETASEVNNKCFIVERSIDAELFEPVLQQSGAGNSTQVQYYSDIDNDPIIGLSYYRLKQVDFDGKFTYSKVVPVNFQDTKEQQLLVYPNPFRSGQSLRIDLPGKLLLSEKQFHISIYDIEGRQVWTESDKTLNNKDSNNFTLNNIYLQTGTYTVVLSTAQGAWASSFVVK